MYMLLIAQAAETVPSIPKIEGAPEWLNNLLPILGTIITIIAGWWFKVQREKIKAELQNENLTRKEKLELRFKDFAMMRAMSFVERDFLEIANAIIKGKEKGDSESTMMSRAKDQLKLLHGRLIEEAQAYFNNEDIDIVAELGEEKIDRIIEWAANKVSPFPGKPTVKALVEGGAERLVEKGSAWLRNQIVTVG